MSQVQSIKCTNCAAPLKLLGGGRVESITCSYCTSVLDLNDNYKVLSNFKNVRMSYSLPFEVGMRGKLKGIDYTIIGRVSYNETIHVEHTWSDFLLFSPLYGYAWLSYEQGHLIYSKRNRTFPNLTWEEIENQSLVVVDSKNYKPYDAYTAKITYVEGELTWVAKYGDKINYIDLVATPFGITAENNGVEIEFYNDEYMDRDEVYEAFSIAEEKRDGAGAFHPLKPFSRPVIKALSKVSLWFMLIVGLLMLAVMFDGSGKSIAHFRADNSASIKEPFSLSSTKYLTTIHVKADSAKALKNFNIKLFKDEKLLFSLTQKNAYIFDPTTNKVSKHLNRWERRAKEIIVYLDLDKLGVYQLSVLPIDSAISSKLNIRVKEKSSRVNYLFIFVSLLLLFTLYYYFLAWRYRVKQSSEKELDNDKESILDGIGDWEQILFWIFLVIFFIFIDGD